MPSTSVVKQWDYIAKLVCIGDSGTGKSSLTVRLCEGRFSPHHDVTIGVEFGSRILPVGPPASLKRSKSDFSSLEGQSQPSTSNSNPYAAPSNPPSTSPTKQTTTSKPSPSKPQPQDDEQKYMKLSLWDTAGQETYKSVTRSYFRGASGALLVFDITRRSTFESVTSWLEDLRAIAEEGIVVALVGNKVDLVEDEDKNENESIDGDAGAAASESQPPSATASTPTSAKPPPRRAVTRSEAQAWCATHGIHSYTETSAKSGANVEFAFQLLAEQIFSNILKGQYDLNDRRSGVKGFGMGNGRQTTTNSREVVLGVSDVKSMRVGGGCC